jgi:Uma2 family endonuclease
VGQVEGKEAVVRAQTSVLPMTRREWRVLVDSGTLDGQRVELLEGSKWEMSPESSLHTLVIERLARQLVARLGDKRHHVSVGHPVALDELSEPEPDIAVVRGGFARFEQLLAAGDHPGGGDVELVIEVAASSRVKDLQVKPARYASAGIGEYWVVDLVDDVVVVHTLVDGRYRTARHARGASVRCEALAVDLSPWESEGSE